MGSGAPSSYVLSLRLGRFATTGWVLRAGGYVLPIAPIGPEREHAPEPHGGDHVEECAARQAQIRGTGRGVDRVEHRKSQPAQNGDAGGDKRIEQEHADEDCSAHQDSRRDAGDAAETRGAQAVCRATILSTGRKQ